MARPRSAVSRYKHRKNMDQPGIREAVLYTLAEAAGARAKASLEKMFPGSVVEVNSDLVATDKLRNLARSADIFVFTWKSSSHAAFYCIKDELPGGEPIWAAGKGTASIIRAVIEKAGEI